MILPNTQRLMSLSSVVTTLAAVRGGCWWRATADALSAFLPNSGKDKARASRPRLDLAVGDYPQTTLCFRHSSSSILDALVSAASTRFVPPGSPRHAMPVRYTSSACRVCASSSRDVGRTGRRTGRRSFVTARILKREARSDDETFAAGSCSLYTTSFTGPSPSYDSTVMRTHLLLLFTSYKLWTGKYLLGLDHDSLELSTLVDKAYRSEVVLLSHGIQPSPVFNYGNLKAQELWKTDWVGLTSMPSKLTAEPDRREERQRILEKTAKDGFVEGYNGVRISTTGERFTIQNVTIWDVVVDEKQFDCQFAEEAASDCRQSAPPRDRRIAEEERDFPLRSAQGKPKVRLPRNVPRRSQDGLLKLGQAATYSRWLALPNKC